MTNQRLIYIFLILLIAAICFSPRFSLGYLPLTQRSIDIRAEDIILALGLFFSGISFLARGKSSFKTPPLFWPIFSWVVFGFFSILVNALIYRINVGLFFFYFLKELEFFVLYFLVFSWINTLQKNVSLLKYWILFYVVNIGWLVYVFLNKVNWSSYYGPNIFSEPKGPFPSGGFFLMLFIFLFNLYLFYFQQKPYSHPKKLLLLFLCAGPALGVLASGSFTAIVGLSFSLALSLFIYFFHSIGPVRLIQICLIMLLASVIVIGAIGILDIGIKISKKKLLYEYVLGDPASRIASGDAISRIGIFKYHLATIANGPIINFFIGRGIVGEAHSAYMRVFLERGIIGLGLFAFLIYSVLITCWRHIKANVNPYAKSLCLGLLVATFTMLVMAVPNDVFSIVKLDEVYWFFAAMAMAAIKTT